MKGKPSAKGENHRWLGFVLSGMLILAGGLGTLAALGSNVYVSDGRGEPTCSRTWCGQR